MDFFLIFDIIIYFVYLRMRIGKGSISILPREFIVKPINFTLLGWHGD